MTEKEAIEILADFDLQVTAKADGAYQSTIGKMACEVAIKALEEVQEYRAIGTLEEVRNAVEKQKPKKPDYEGDGYAAEYLVMGQCVMNDAISRLAREKGMTYDEAREYIVDMMRRIDDGN